MEKRFLAFVSLLFLLASCQTGSRKEFRSLDRAIEMRDVYDARNEQLIRDHHIAYRNAESDSAKWEAAHKLERDYYIHDLDSCYHYISEMLRLMGDDMNHRIISTASYAQNLYRVDSLVKATVELEKIDLSAVRASGRETVDAYCRSAYQVYRSLQDTVNFNRIVNLWWESDSTNAGAVFNHDTRLLDSGRYDEVLAHMDRCVCRTPRDSAIFYYYVARVHQRAGNINKAIRNYAKSSEYDMYVSGKTYSSLLELSKLLFQKGDIKRADNYLRIALNDAKIANWSLRYNSILQSEFTVMNALLSQSRQKQQAVIAAMVVTALLLLVATILLLYISRQASRLAKSEKALQEVSTIKDNFLAHYMETSVDYLNKVDEYRSTLRSAIKNEGVDAVKTMLRMPSFTAGEFETLLEEFDSTFLGIFPDFVEKVNTHMQEGHKLTQPAPGKLSTELRILALVKMGINKRQKIAKVLNMSVTTVYSYHSNLQKYSLHPDPSFDRVIAGL